ncbi:unnamed protein product [Eruca vesicaria subsp. sativa]|uniref:FBD domain-containing protein n=1 Tax=Eruca vesicaria subsp. sativa TaxID=29727 RepID=A0ABC8K1U7_ERUVS|nr:unnamed protein product [Eruca vesicaria subsp. sativa]
MELGALELSLIFDDLNFKSISFLVSLFESKSLVNLRIRRVCLTQGPTSPPDFTLYYRGDEIPVFNNLISLSLGSDKPHGTPYIFWKLLPSLLLKAPNLQTLIIKGLVHYVKKGWEVGLSLRLSLDDMPDALSSSEVKVLKITGYEGTGEELAQMECFLGKLTHLEMVRVTHKVADDGERLRLVNDLLHLPRASSKCKLQVMKQSA